MNEAGWLMIGLGVGATCGAFLMALVVYAFRGSEDDER